MPLTWMVLAAVLCYQFLPAFCVKSAVLIVGDDAGFENSVYGNRAIDTPGLQSLSERGVTFDQAFTLVSSCSPSRSVILTGLPPHQNGMYGLHHDVHNFNSFSTVRALPTILHGANVRTGIIGKKHVGPEEVYRFDYEETEENNPTNMVGRNITHIAMLVDRFMNSSEGRPFFLYVAFHDPHRCRNSPYGGFCERYGNGQPGMGLIADWKPHRYDPEQVVVPYFVPDTPAARQDVAAQYTAVNRMDQGITFILELLKKHRIHDQTLVIYTSDNGIPFPSGRTNLYDPGMREPLILSDPSAAQTHGTRSDDLVSLADITPTILHWFGVPYPKYRIFQHDSQNVKLRGRSLLRRRIANRRRHKNSPTLVFGSHSLHEISMYYPIRVARTKRHKLIHNLNWQAPFPIDQDFAVSATFQDLLQRTLSHNETHWYKNITGYYYRPEYELYDIVRDKEEMKNLAKEQSHRRIFHRLRVRLRAWQNATNDPWLCAPHAVVETTRVNKHHRFAQCLALYN